MEYFKSLADQLRKELEYDREQHKMLMLNNNVSERKRFGVTWHPIQIISSSLGRGDYLTVTLNRTNNLDTDHQFRFGMPVSLFSGFSPLEDRINGVIVYVGRDTMRISLCTEELPDWSRQGKLGVDLLFDENTYAEMQAALKEADQRINDKTTGELVRTLVGIDEDSISYNQIPFEDSSYNDSQNSAIQFMSASNPISLLHGPPGTGKTTTLVGAVTALLRKTKAQILITAPSNVAVDVLTERLYAAGVKVVRVGNPIRVSDELQSLTLDSQIQKHTANKELKNLEKQARIYADMASKYKRNFGRAEREQRKALLDETRKIRKEIDRLEDYVIANILDGAEVITATLVGANHYSIRDRKYKTVIIDEAGQALEPACWIPILKAETLILAGDHCQLPPTVKHSQDRKSPLYRTLFEKIIVRYPKVGWLLDTQYRMNRKIMEYSSRQLYNGTLNAAETVADWSLIDDLKPMLFIDTAGAGYEEEEIDNSLINKEEANFLLSQVYKLIDGIKQDYTVDNFPSIGLISPYRQQVRLLTDLLNYNELSKEWAKHIQVSTIDGFQGQEKDVIFISLVRSNKKNTIGFLEDVRRMNVALTRARKKLVVIGDSGTIGQHPFYRGFLEYIDSINGYHSVWEE